MDKINTVSSQAVLKMPSSFSIDTRLMSSLPLVNGLFKKRLFKTAPDIDEPPFQLIHTMDLSDKKQRSSLISGKTETSIQY